MKKYLLFLMALITVISCKNNGNEDEIKPSKKNITESVYASVSVTPKTSYNPQPLRSGVIDKILVSEGEIVKKNQLLFQISPTTNVSSQLTNAQISLNEAKSNYLGQNNMLTNHLLEIKTIEEKLSLDSINYQRQVRLIAQNVSKKIDYDQAKLNYDNTKNQLEIAKQNYSQKKNSLRNIYKKALNQSKSGKNDLNDFSIHSKINGKVYTVNKEEGDFISAQEKFAEIGSYDQFIIEMDIDEVDITKINLSDTVIINLDAYGKQVFLATVSKIYPKKNNISQTFKVESEFIEQPPKLYYGLTGEANIVISKRKNALIIPTNYLNSNNTVMTQDGEKIITIGMKNLEFVEVLSGLDTSSILVKPEY